MHGPTREAGDLARTPTPWALLSLLMAMTAIGPMALNILVPALPRLVERLATDTGTVQLTVSLYLVSLASAQLVLGPLSDRFGRRPVVLAGLALTVLASAASIAATSIGGLIVSRVLQALGASTGVVVGRAIIRDLFARDRAASMIGLVATVMVVAPMVAPMIGGLLEAAFGWSSIFVFVTVASAIVLCWAALALPETRVRGTAGEDGSFFVQALGLARSRSFIGYVLCAALGSSQFFIVLGGGPHAVVSIMGRTPTEYGVWFAVASFGYMSGNFTASRLAVSRGVDKLIWWGILIEIGGALLSLAAVMLFPAGGPATIFLPQCVISFGNGLLLPNAFAGAVSVKTQAAGAASGITGFVQMGLGAAAAQLMGHLLAHATSALPIPLAIMAAGLVTAAAYLGLIGLRRGPGVS
jgi:DHA1 family bicyclomycin/chloramphenicol resistance-like MFS transporter